MEFRIEARSSMRRGRQGSPHPLRKSRSLSRSDHTNARGRSCSSRLSSKNTLVPEAFDRSYNDWCAYFEDPSREFRPRGFINPHDSLISGHLVRSESLDGFVMVERNPHNEAYDPFAGGRFGIFGPLIARTVQKINYETGKFIKKCLPKEKPVEVKADLYVSYEINAYGEVLKKEYPEDSGRYKRFYDDEDY